MLYLCEQICNIALMSYSEVYICLKLLLLLSYSTPSLLWNMLNLAPAYRVVTRNTPYFHSLVCSITCSKLPFQSPVVPDPSLTGAK